MTEPSDVARDVLARYRRSISPSASERESLVRTVAHRVEGGHSGSGVAAASSGRGAPWLVVLGTALVIVGGAWWGGRSETVAPVDAAFAGVRVTRPPSPSAPPVIAIAPLPPIAVPPKPAMPEPVDDRRPERAPARPARAKVAEASPEPVLVDEEVRLLREANAALRDGRDASARARFDEHARRFPHGSLVELREVGRARMQCRAATPDAAAQVIAAFAERFPDSPHLARITRECPPTGAP